MLFFHIFLFLQSACSYDNITPTSNKFNNSHILDLVEDSNATVDATKINETKTISMERITQPSQSRQIERTLEPDSSILNNSLTATKKQGNFDHFKPSPLLDVQYEFNKFPVKPAFPEAKTFSSFNEDRYPVDSWTERPLNTADGKDKFNNQGPWFESSKGTSWDDGNSKFSVNSWNNKPTTTEQTWISKVKFPTPPQEFAVEKPYTFVTNNNRLQEYSPTNYPTASGGFSFNKPVQPSNNNNKPSEGFWDKFLGASINKNSPAPIQKTFTDYNLLEKPPYQNSPKDYGHGVSGTSNPWHKVIKLLTTIIPIGLLISALTPTVITVTSVNDTQSRYRAENLKHPSILDHLSSTQNYINFINGGSCEEKILCELLVNASSSKNYEEHIENLLNTFTKNEDLGNKKEALLKIFDAVKKEDCSSIPCRNVKNPI